MRRSPLLALAAVTALAALALLSPPRTRAQGDSPLPNVTWGLVDSISACPAGDSVVAGDPNHYHPSRLRITVRYTDANEEAKAGVPPESIWVSYTTTSGNLLVNDQGSNVYADDSTNSFGRTRITIPSFSGSGTLSVTLKVSGVSQGSKSTPVRTVDPDASGRDSAEISVGDIDWSGGPTHADSVAAQAHLYHWHREVLHGTLVRRSNLCDYCPIESNNTIGAGDQSWSWDGIWIAYSSRDTCPPPTCGSSGTNPCRIKVIPADPARGTVPFTVTFNGAPADSEDYDPSWSPTRGVLYFVRDDRVIYRKGVAGIAADTSLQAIIRSDVPTTYAEVSPDGDSLAYVQQPGNYFEVFISPATGGSARQLTTDAANYSYPRWSADGSVLLVTRRNPSTNYKELYKLRVRGDPSPTPFYANSSADATDGDFSPDTLVVFGARAATVTDAVPTTFDNAYPDTVGIPNYREFSPWVGFPKISPDGTRSSVIAYDPAISGAVNPQVWAARRNMNLPPKFTSVGASTVADSTTTVSFQVNQGTTYFFTVAATDPEGDALTYQRFFLQSWMGWTESTHTLSVSPGGTVGATYDVVLQCVTGSGGADFILARFTVCPSGGCGGGLAQARESGAEVAAVLGANPTRGPFVLATPKIAGAEPSLLIFDVAGRRVAAVSGRAGAPIVWDGTRNAGERVPNGVYLYRLVVGSFERRGRMVLIR